MACQRQFQALYPPVWEKRDVSVFCPVVVQGGRCLGQRSAPWGAKTQGGGGFHPLPGAGNHLEGASVLRGRPRPQLGRSPAGAHPCALVFSESAGRHVGGWALLSNLASPVSLQCAPENTLPTPMVLQR